MKTKDFIKDLRKKNKLSIKDFASKINVKESLINDYENGKKEPSIRILKRIGKIFGNDLNSIDNNYFINKINNKTKHNRIIVSFLIIISIICCTLGVIIYNNIKNNYISIYSFNGESDTFKFNNGLVVFSDDNRYIELSGFKIKNNINIKSMTINVAFNESIWAIKEYDSTEGENLNQWLKHVEISEYNKDGFIFNNKYKSDSFSKYVTKFPYDFKVEINYCTDEDCNVEILDIKSEKLNTKNKIKNK